MTIFQWDCRIATHQLLKIVNRALEKGSAQALEKEALVHTKEILTFLDRAAKDGAFVCHLIHCWEGALGGIL